MAGRRGRGYRGKGNYKFTYKRKAALARAQKISARKRRGDSPLKKAGKIAGIAAVGATTAYLGYRHRGTIGKTASNWRSAVQPGAKEKVRINNSISGGHPSRTTITSGDRLRAQNTRNQLSRPRPDRKIYDADGNVNTEAMTNRGVRQTLKKHRKTAIQGTKASTGKISKARSDNGYSDSEWQSIFAFEDRTRKNG